MAEHRHHTSASSAQPQSVTATSSHPQDSDRQVHATRDAVLAAAVTTPPAVKRPTTIASPHSQGSSLSNGSAASVAGMETTHFITRSSHGRLSIETRAVSFRRPSLASASVPSAQSFATRASSSAVRSPLPSTRRESLSDAKRIKPVAFYIPCTDKPDILPFPSPGSQNKRARSPSLESACLRVPASFPRISSPNCHPHELLLALTARQKRADMRRSHLLQERRLRLRRRAEQIRYHILLQRQRDRLNSLKIQARSEYAISTASLKRQLIIKKNVERCGAAVQHAQTVAMMHKLRKLKELRRAFSETFAEYLCDAGPTGVAGIQLLPHVGMHKAISLDGLCESDDDYVESCRGLWPEFMMTQSFDLVSPSSARLSKADLSMPRVHDAALNPTEGDAVVSGSLHSAGAESSQAGQTRRLTEIVEGNLTGVSSESNTDSNNGGESGEADDLNIFALHTDVYGESLSATVRRLRVLPVALLEDMEESAYLELLELLPPITRFTLRELELSEILSNAQLRHDLFFDPELQFKPNLDGEKGRQKREAADAYWEEVDSEVNAGHLYRLPLLLFEMRVIIIELLPYSAERKEDVERHIDVRLIAQQMQHGVLDALALVQYIADLLKANCAPARDCLVDAMVAECQGGNFVKTLRQCFEVLEFMKLDYANHELHRVRPYVVEHAADYEWRWFKEQYQAGLLRIDDTTLWLASTLDAALDGPTSAGEVTSAQQLHIRAFLNIISRAHMFSEPEGATSMPEVLRMDIARLVQYYNDWQDVTIMAALLVLFKQAAGPKCTSADLREAKRVLWVLLNDSDTSMQHVTLQMCDSAGKIRGKPFSQHENDMLSGLVESTLQPDSKLYQIIRTRVGTSLECRVRGEPFEKHDLNRMGLAELDEEVAELGERIKRLVAHNWRVFGDLYMAIVDQLGGLCGTVQVEGRLEAVLSA